MMTTATHNEHDITPEGVLFVAFELSEKAWKLGCTTGQGHKPRERTVCAVALPRDRGSTGGGRPQRGLSGFAVLRHSSALVLVEATR